MKIEEKLQYFMNSAIKDSQEQSDKMLKDYEAHLEQAFKEHQEEVLQKANLEIKYESERIRHEGNKNLAKEHLHIRRKLIKKNNELTGKIFDEVLGLLESYKKTPAYEQLLIKQIQNIIAFAKGEDTIIYMDPDDADKKAFLEKKTNTFLTVSEYSFNGGIRAVIPSRSILIDHSFQSKLADARENFRFSGGNIHDN